MGCALVTTSYVPIASPRVLVISSGVEKSLKIICLEARPRLSRANSDSIG